MHVSAAKADSAQLRHVIDVLQPGNVAMGTASKAFALRPLALQLAGAPHCLGGQFGKLLVMATKRHLPEHPLPLHLFLERFERPDRDTESGAAFPGRGDVMRLRPSSMCRLQ